MIDLSFVLPCHNEEENLAALIEEISRAATAVGRSFEIIVTDDRSTDGSWDLLRRLAAENPTLRAQRLDRRSGQSAASFAGIRAARGAVVVTMDGDRQNDPADLPKLLDALEGADCVCGSRRKSRARGDNRVKTVTSRVANRVRARVLGDTLSDAGCNFRAFRREAVEHIPFFKGVHRFLPILMAFQGWRVTEVDVANRARAGGQSHYGLFDRAGSIPDMLAVRWMRSRVVPVRVAERFPADGDGEGPGPSRA